MIAITTENGILRIAAELPIPNGQNWSPSRIAHLVTEIGDYVFFAETLDKPGNSKPTAPLCRIGERRSARP